MPSSVGTIDTQIEQPSVRSRLILFPQATFCRQHPLYRLVAQEFSTTKNEVLNMITVRKSRPALAVLTFAVLAIFHGGSALAEGGRSVHMRFAGDFIQNVEQTEFDPMGVPVGTSTVGLVRAKAVGNLGFADLSAITKATPPESDEGCPEGFSKVADIISNNLVFTFFNLDLLYGDGDGAVCVNASGEQFVSIAGNWHGGTGRFRNASGDFVVRIDEFALVSAATQVVAEAGTITGSLKRGK